MQHQNLARYKKQECDNDAITEVDTRHLDNLNT